MTNNLVNGDDESKRFGYALLVELISSYENHERLEKKTMVDDFEDDFFAMGDKKKKEKKDSTVKKHAPEVLRDI